MQMKNNLKYSFYLSSEKPDFLMQFSSFIKILVMVYCIWYFIEQ